MSELIEKGDVLGVISCFFKDNYIEDADWHLADLEREINRLDAASPWHRVEEPPKEDGWYILGFLSRWKGGNWWMPNFPDYWMTAEPPKEDA